MPEKKIVFSQPKHYVVGTQDVVFFKHPKQMLKLMDIQLKK